MERSNKTKHETSWRKNNDWKGRYSKLYSSKRISLPTEERPERISFMRNDRTPYTSLLVKMRDKQRDGDSSESGGALTPPRLDTIMTQRSALYGSNDMGSLHSNAKPRSISNENNISACNDTVLLDMVRARHHEMREAQDQTLDLPCDDASDDMSTEACVHGLSVRMTERSISRSRVSRISTRRDMDIPSILAFTTNTSPGPAPLEIPAFQKLNEPLTEDIPRWSIRRSVCPVCSQKWKDRSSISNVKYSGLKRNSSSELPSVIAPARLRTSITMEYTPRPTLAAVDKDAGVIHGGLKNSSAMWQLTRARRFRTPKPQMPLPDANAPPSSTAPLARKDLDLRVNKFLTNDFDNIL